MNFVAHARVASAVAGSRVDGVAFGAVLPDLGSMLGVRIGAAELPERAQLGVRLHHATDAAFHALPEFRAGSRALGQGLRTSGLARGPARAVAHAGWELLLDGCLLEREGAEEEFTEVLGSAPDTLDGSQPTLLRLALDMASERWWLGYREPAIVADRLMRRLRRHPRLAFTPDEVPAVTTALEAERPAVELAAGRVIDTVTAAASSIGQSGKVPFEGGGGS